MGASLGLVYSAVDGCVGVRRGNADEGGSRSIWLIANGKGFPPTVSALLQTWRFNAKTRLLLRCQVRYFALDVQHNGRISPQCRFQLLVRVLQGLGSELCLAPFPVHPAQAEHGHAAPSG